jgi:quinol-cytochrome oxidoreductase complex cytochrome b subunit
MKSLSLKFNFQDMREKMSKAIDHRVRAIMAGLSLDELRALVRGDPPTEKPNPRYRVHTSSFLFHIRPRYYEAGSLVLTHTFRLGFFVTFFFFLEVITGIILMFYYTPSPEKAFGSILYLLRNVPYGQLLRDLHRLGAEGMVIFTALHMLRTFLTGSYKKERSFTWLTGVVLLGITLGLSFSGYLLPWDQLAYWAVTIGTSMAEAAPLFGEQVNLLLRGAPDIGAGGLLRFYLGHVVLLPALAVLVISIHYYKVSREHGISLPAKYEEGNVSPEEKKAARTRVDFLPEILTHDVYLTILGLFIMVVVVTIGGYHAPLEHIANPQATPLDTKAPWYFWWLQGMLKLGDKSLMGIILPTLIVILLVMVPYIDRNPYRSLSKRPIAVGLGILAVLILVVLSYMGLPEYGIKLDAATRVVQDMAPEEGVGPLREISFDQLRPGVYEVNGSNVELMCKDLDYGCPELEEVFALFSEKINQYKESGALPEGQAFLVIEDWQFDEQGSPTLKKITLRVVWQVIEEGKEKPVTKTYEKLLFIHKDHNAGEASLPGNSHPVDWRTASYVTL